MYVILTAPRILFLIQWQKTYDQQQSVQKAKKKLRVTLPNFQTNRYQNIRRSEILQHYIKTAAEVEDT